MKLTGLLHKKNLLGPGINMGKTITLTKTDFLIYIQLTAYL